MISQGGLNTSILTTLTAGLGLGHSRGYFVRL